MKKNIIKNDKKNEQKFQNLVIAKGMQKQVKGGRDVIIIDDHIDI